VLTCMVIGTAFGKTKPGRAHYLDITTIRKAND